VGNNYRERKDGQRIGNWEVDIIYLLTLKDQLIQIYLSNDALSHDIRDEKMFSHLDSSIRLLNPWLVYLDSGRNNPNITFSLGQINHLFCEIGITEEYMAVITMRRNQIDISEGHCQRCLHYSRRMVEGERKISAIFNALRTYIQLK
jgi:hypothetical protein